MRIVGRGQDEDPPELARDAAALDAVLDALVSDRPPLHSGTAVMSIADAALALHSLDVRDETPDPTDGFVERLNANLFGAAGQPPVGRGQVRDLQTASPHLAHAHRAFDRRRGRPTIAWLSTAAMVGLTLGSVLAAFRWSDGRNSPDDRPEIAVGGAASATAAADVCDGAPSASAFELVLRVHATDDPGEADAIAAVQELLIRRTDLLGIGACPVVRDGPDIFVVRFAEADDPTFTAVKLALGTVGLLELVDVRDRDLSPGALVRTSLDGSSVQAGTSTTESIYETIVSSSDVSNAFLATSSDGQPAVGFQLTGEASERLCDFTGLNVGRSLAVVLDKRVLYTMAISGPVCGGQGLVEGRSVAQAHALVVQLQSGPLPAPVEVVYERTPATPAASPRVTMLTGPEIVDVSECSGRLRPPGTVEGLAGDEPTRASILPLRSDSSTPRAAPRHDVFVQPSDVDPLEGLPRADASIVEQVQATLRQLVACLLQSDLLFGPPLGEDDWTPYDDYNGPFFSNFSDDYFRRGLVGQVSNVDLPVLETSFLILGPRTPELTDLRVLPDGRVIALLPDTYFASITHQVVFVLEGDRWLIDETARVVAEDRDFQVEAAAAPQFLEVVLSDDAAEVWGPVDPDQKVVADEDLTVTIANLGTVPQRFEILGFGVSLEIPPGHSVAFVVNAPPGATMLVSYRLDPDGSEVRVLDRPLTFRPEGTFCRFCG